MDTYEVDPTNPFIVPALALSGRLKDHKVPCEECSGTGCSEHGYEDDCKECTSFSHGCDHSSECSYCDQGEVFWGSWYATERVLCHWCDTHDVWCAEMYDCNDDDRNWICLPCYIKHHKERCGCGRWKKYERMLGIR